MGLSLSIPVIILFNFVKKQFFRSTEECEDLGMMVQVKQQIISLILKISRFWQTRRVQNISFGDPRNGELHKIGLLPSQQDRDLDIPSEQIPQQENVIDGVCVSGYNSKGDCLKARIARRSEDRVEVTLYLRLADGSEYVLPNLPDTRGYASDAHSFSSCGLKIQCLSPNCRWRIAYNGLLRKVSKEGEETPEIVHVKFAFVWRLVTLAYDFQTDFDCDLLADAVSKDHSLFFFSELHKLKDRLNFYEQWGQFAGTVSIGTEEEKEIYLWGPKTRHRGILDWSEIAEYFSAYGIIKDGLKFHIGTISIPGIVSKLKYGYIVKPDHVLLPVESCYFETSDGDLPGKIVFNAGGNTYNIYYYRTTDGFDAYYGDRWNISSRYHYSKFSLDDYEGRGFVEIGKRNETVKPPSVPQIRPCLLREPDVEGVRIPWVVSFTEMSCRKTGVSGGKGSSLAMLAKLSTVVQKSEDSFTVPKGIVVTTSAYRHHLSRNVKMSNEISSLSSNQKLKDLEKLSKTLMSSFHNTTLSEELKVAILEKLQRVFPEGLADRTFAVRSSAAGEDSEETSAAGQMETFLGVKTIDEIYKHLLKCWSSQFSLPAINYKRQTGQILDSDMAVVIQQMVPAEVAGVAFTCDPVTCNPENITITANYGLGESVVSATAEPDTIVLKRTIDNRLVIHSESIGRKGIRIKMSSEGGVSSEDVEDNDSKKCCLKSEDSLKIGRVAILVEQSFGNPRDIEWAKAGDKLYLLQARPITTCDRETDFEIVHELDTGALSEFEYVTKANVGEVMPGAMSPLAASTANRIFDIVYQHLSLVRYGPSIWTYHPFFDCVLFYHGGHNFINIMETVLRQVNKKENAMTYSFQWSMFGREIENADEMRNIALHRYGEFPALKGITNLLWVFYDSFFVPRRLKEAISQTRNGFLPQDMKFPSSHQLYTIISQMLPKHCLPSRAHCDCSGLSSLYNAFILGILANAAGGMNETLLSHLSKFLSNCENVESADVPQSMKNLADTIVLHGAKEKMLSMSAEEAAKWLQEEDGPLGAEYREFLRQHGHRCLMEFDVYRRPWNEDPVLLVKSLQLMVRQPNDRSTKNQMDNSVDSVVPTLTITNRFLLKILVKWAKQGVSEREKSKSVLIKSVDIFRKAYRKLGEMMCKEGRIPDQDLICFMTHEEIGELLKSRSARIVSKAIRRKRIHPILEIVRYPEISCGPPQPIKVEVDVTENGISDWIIKATPVSQGKVTARARVVLSLDEAHSIEPGDILVAYSTDVGWTPYFPTLSGVVTELGGLISHGAVVAREFGLPCIVGAVNATSIVKTGDLVVLDGKSGTLKKVTETE